MHLPNFAHLLTWVSGHWKDLSLAKIKSWFMAYWRMNQHSEWKKAEESLWEDGAPSQPIGWATEQFNYRVDRVSKISPKCLEGQCTKCGCDTPDKFWEDLPCESGCYGKWMTEQEWNEFKNKPQPAK